MLRARNIKSFLRRALLTIPYGLLRIISIILSFIRNSKSASYNHSNVIHPSSKHHTDMYHNNIRMSVCGFIRLDFTLTIYSLKLKCSLVRSIIVRNRFLAALRLYHPGSGVSGLRSGCGTE